MKWNQSTGGCVLKDGWMCDKWRRRSI